MSPEPSDRPPLLEARGLRFARDDEPVFGPLDFALREGEVLVVEGGNGSGKTTLIRLLAGLIDATDGELWWRGVEAGRAAHVPGDIALLGHQLGLKPELTPLELLRFRIALSGARGITAHAALKSAGLEGYEDLPLRTFSAGQRKRVALATLLVLAAGVWLLDEPYANLDRDGRVLVDRMLDAHCRRGGCAVLTSHGLITPAVARFAVLELNGRA
jgi:heme exporter protein A